MESSSLALPRLSPLKLSFVSESKRFFSLPTRVSASTSAEAQTQLVPIHSSVDPVYQPTPKHRPLRTPHSGYHFDGTGRPFFEGWYFKVSIPECRQSFCFMYSVENPSFPNGMSGFDKLVYGERFTGVGAQILGADDKYICQFDQKSNNFWGNRHELMLGNTFVKNGNSTPPTEELPPEEFDKRVSEGFQVTPVWHQGSIRDDGRSSYVETVKSARWRYSTKPVYGWGDVKSKQKSTAGWLAAFPVFEPHWQVCMAGGLSTGWIEWGDEWFEFEDAPSYSEKNWGAGFPRKWYWIQCNVFEGTSDDVALTAAGGLRQLGLFDNYESPSLIGVHHGGIFYEFVPWTGQITWDVSPWGFWKMTGQNQTHLVELEATTKEKGTALRAPTKEAGLVPACKDTCYGDLKLQLWEKNYSGTKGKLILDVRSNMAALEVGGGPWFSGWKGKTESNEVLSNVLRAQIDMDSFFPIPVFKPPGL
ncbi:hypothetical protein LUZ60_012594 [Juncus effusus]|nr:hypothetical protein LUZ60_012594 [Juncus effusus]